MRAETKSPEEARRLTPVPIGGRPGGWRGRNLNDGWFPFCREFWGSDTDGAAAEPVLRGRFQQKPPTHDNGPVSRCRPGEYDCGGREPLTNEGKDGRRKEKPERRKGGAGRRYLRPERRAAPSLNSGEGAGVCRRGRKASRAFHGAFSQGKQTKRSARSARRRCSAADRLSQRVMEISMFSVSVLAFHMPTMRPSLRITPGLATVFQTLL